MTLMTVVARALTKFVRVPPRKARLVADLIRGKGISEASSILQFSPHRVARHLKKTLDSAVANAETLTDSRREELCVAEVRIDPGPVLKRAKPRNRGSQHPIMKRMSHLTVVLGKLPKKEGAQ